MILDKFKKKNLIHPPKWLLEGDKVCYLTIMGSQAYGVNTANSDVDVYGIVVPPKHILFPHTVGIIKGFGNQGEIFHQWQEHHIIDPDKKVEHDFSVYNIVKFFQLAMENNPNILDSLWTPDNCVVFKNYVGDFIRLNRKVFLSKKCWHTHKGYAYAQLAKIKNKVNSNNPDRAELIEKHGYDLKFAMHTVRLLNQVEQLLTEGDMDLQRNNDQLKSIRRGEWKLTEILDYFKKKESELETAYLKSDLPYAPDEERIKEILVDCIKMYYDDTDTELCTKRDRNRELLQDLKNLVWKYD